MTSEGDKQAGEAFGRFAIIRFIKECSRYPAYTEQMGNLMQLVCDDLFNKELPRSWVDRQAGKTR